MSATRVCLSTLLICLSCATLAQSGDGDIQRVIGERYGVNPAHRVDVYWPTEVSDTPRPLVTLVGGDLSETAWNREEMAAAAEYFARRSYVAVVAGYRPIGEFQWPQGADEMRDIAGWVRASLDRFGAASEGMMMDGIHGMFVVAVGTGARHMTTYLFHEPAKLGRGGTGISAAVLISPELEGPDSAAVARYYLNNQDLLESAQPLALVESYEPPVPPLLIVNAVGDGPVRSTQALALQKAICGAHASCPELLNIANADSAALMASFGSDMSGLAASIEQFFQSAVAAE